MKKNYSSAFVVLLFGTGLAASSAQALPYNSTIGASLPAPSAVTPVHFHRGRPHPNAPHAVMGAPHGGHHFAGPVFAPAPVVQPYGRPDYGAPRFGGGYYHEPHHFHHRPYIAPFAAAPFVYYGARPSYYDEDDFAVTSCHVERRLKRIRHTHYYRVRHVRVCY